MNNWAFWIAVINNLCLQMFGTLLSEATAQTNWAALFVDLTTSNTLTTLRVLASWALEDWSALQDLAAAIVLGLYDRLAL